MTGQARVRVIPNVPWTFDFEYAASAAPPTWWTGAPGKVFQRTVEGVGKVLVRPRDETVGRRAKVILGPANLKGYTIDLPADVQAKFKGKPVVLATAVINSGGVDIAKKPIPPMTADDLALQKIMTKLPPAQAALRKALDGKDLNLVKEQATILKTAFTDTEAFWKAKGNTDAMNIAAEGKKHADAILINIGLGSMEAAKTSITPLGATCASCHGKYRDRMDDGTFRIKTGG